MTSNRTPSERRMVGLLKQPLTYHHMVLRISKRNIILTKRKEKYLQQKRNPFYILCLRKSNCFDRKYSLRDE